MRCSSGLALWLLAACACAGEISVEWIAPTENEDGTPLTDLVGYRVYYGPASGSYASVFEVSDPTATTATVPNVFPGDYYVAMTALDADGNESTYSNEVLKAVPAVVLPGAATLAANGEWLVDPPQPPPGGGDVAITLPVPYSRFGTMKPLGKVEVDRSNPWGARLVFGVTFSESGPANLGGTALNGAPANNVARDITGRRQATHAIGGTVINRKIRTNLSSALPKNSNRVYQQQISSTISVLRFGFEYGDELDRSYSMVDEINDAGGDWMAIARVRRWLNQHTSWARIFSIRNGKTGDIIALGVSVNNQAFGRHNNETVSSNYTIPENEWVTIVAGRAGGNRFAFVLEDDTTVRGYQTGTTGSPLALSGSRNEVGVGTMAGANNGRFFRGEIDYVYLFKGVTDLRDQDARVAAARQVAQAPWQFLRPATPAPVLTIPAAGGGITLSVDGAIHGHTAEVIALTQKGTVSVAESLHAHTADNLVLGVGAAVPLAVSRPWNLQDGGDGRGDMLPSMGGGTLSAYPIGPTSFLWPHRFVITNPSASWRVVSSVSLDGSWTFGPGPNASFDRGAQTGVASFDYEILNGNAAGDTFTGTHTVSVQ